MSLPSSPWPSLLVVSLGLALACDSNPREQGKDIAEAGGEGSPAAA